MLKPRLRQHLCTWGLGLLGAAAISLVSDTAAAAEPTGGAGKRFRFHGETDFMGFTHVNPDGDGDNFNNFGFGFGRSTGVDTGVGRPIWSLGFGYVFLESRAVVGAKFAFVVDTGGTDDEGDGDDTDPRTTSVGGLFVPYFRYIFMPGKRIRPFLEGRFGLGGITISNGNDQNDDRDTTNVVYPVVGLGGGAHFFIIDAFSVDAGLTLDYWAPHERFRSESGDETVEDDYEKEADVLNLGVQAGLSVWF